MTPPTSAAQSHDSSPESTNARIAFQFARIAFRVSVFFVISAAFEIALLYAPIYISTPVIFAAFFACFDVLICLVAVITTLIAILANIRNHPFAWRVWCAVAFNTASVVLCINVITSTLSIR
jgi:hypothetical protein